MTHTTVINNTQFLAGERVAFKTLGGGYAEGVLVKDYSKSGDPWFGDLVVDYQIGRLKPATIDTFRVTEIWHL